MDKACRILQGDKLIIIVFLEITRDIVVWISFCGTMRLLLAYLIEKLPCVIHVAFIVAGDKGLGAHAPRGRGYMSNAGV